MHYVLTNHLYALSKPVIPVLVYLYSGTKLVISPQMAISIAHSLALPIEIKEILLQKQYLFMIGKP